MRTYNKKAEAYNKYIMNKMLLDEDRIINEYNKSNTEESNPKTIRNEKYGV